MFMTNLITEDIRAVIEKNLPAVTAGALRERLAQADKLEEALEKAKQDLATVKAISRDQTDQIEALNKKLTAHAALDKREVEITKREYELELTLIKAQLVSANSNTEFTRSLLNNLVRNTDYRSSVYESRPPTPVVTPNGYVDRNGSPENTVITKTDNAV